MPFFNEEFWGEDAKNKEASEHPFWKEYKEAYANTLSEAELSNLEGFDRLFFDEEFNADRRLSKEANKAALFIMTYREKGVIVEQLFTIGMDIDIGRIGDIITGAL